MENKINNCVTPSPRKRNKPSESSIFDKSKPFFESPEEIVYNGTRKLMYKCRSCAKNINATKPSNLSSHMSHVHPEIYFAKIKPIVKESFAVKRLRILLNAIEIVTINGRPFSSLRDSGYQAGLERKLQKLKDAGFGINFTDPMLHEVKQYISDIAGKVRSKIQDEVNKKMVSVLVDITTRNGRSVFGITVQFIAGKRLIVRSLGLIELIESHTGINLSRVLYECSKKFGIEKRRIISITTDNGKNVVKMIRDFNEINESSDTMGESTVNLACRSLFHELDESDDEKIDETIEQLLAEEKTEDEALEALFHEQELLANAQLLETVSNDFTCDDEIYEATGTNCIAHTTQLLIKDAINALATRYKNIIELSREAVKFLRKQTTIHEMNATGFKFKMPRIDCLTRWGSTCLMVCF